jgi:hypothetical protein
MSDQQGNFSMALSTGRFLVTAVVGGPFPLPKQQEVTVTQGQFTYVHLRLDSGIR